MISGAFRQKSVNFAAQAGYVFIDLVMINGAFFDCLSGFPTDAP
jgi:hypothetical protein